MPIDKFKFVSPGVQVAEIDNSQRPAEPIGTGPAIIGRAQRGPGLRPVQVNSFSEFAEIFGMPWAGGDGNDVWRNGNKMAPSYGAYAAQAYLKNSSPLVYVRLLGSESPDATATGMAGWKVGDDFSDTDAGGNLGLFLIHSSSLNNDQTGSLAAVFYCSEGSVELSGVGAGGTALTGTAGLVQTVGSDYELKALVKDDSGNEQEINFNFNRNSKKYIRKVFNTNPSLLNGRISGAPTTVFLGESYDHAVADLGGAPDASEAYGCLMTLALPDTTIQQNDQNQAAQPAETGWIFAQDLGGTGSYSTDTMPNLFKFKSINAGAWESQNLKISISDVLGSTSEFNPYGSFTVEVRSAEDTDGAPQFLERFGTCNLNPNSVNYVARKVGNKYVEWDAAERRYKEYGEFVNMSKFVFIEMNSDLAAGLLNEKLVPFGFRGTPTWETWQFNRANNFPLDPADGTTDFTSDTYAEEPASGANPLGPGEFVFTDTEDITGSFSYPDNWYRQNSTTGDLGSPRDAYFGIQTNLVAGVRFDGSYKDVVRPFPNGADPQTGPTNASGTFTPNNFSLDDLQWLSSSFAGVSTTQVEWLSGSRFAGDSITAQPTSDWSEVLEAGFNKFTMPLKGGFDGENVVEADPFGAGAINAYAAVNEAENYAFNSVRQAIDTCADPEVVTCNMMSVPGNYVDGVTDYVLTTCEKRADSLAVIDIAGGYVPPADHAGQEKDSDVDTTITNLRNRGINSSYGCTYFPWIQSRDTESSILFYAPPSIAAIGTYSSAQNTSELWFAPAGFTRGGLTEGSAGIPVVGVVQRLTSNDRDKLYEANINPIATFPAEGIVIFGQKTLQVTPSALDRINVRRLLIYVKRQVSYMASRLLFDQNVESTWNRFTGQVNPFLESVKSRLGLEAYKVILDKTTTTPDLIDRNIMYAKIFLKPARAIEFIAIDFVITNAGASFED